jgi:hypothetical protein
MPARGRFLVPLGVVLLLAMAHLTMSGFNAFAGKRGESQTLAVPTNDYGSAGVPFQQASDAGELVVTGNVTSKPSGDTVPNAHVPMCFSDQCVTVKVPQAGQPDGSVYAATLVAGQWYDVSIAGDGSAAFVGCWATTRINGDMNDAGKGVCFPFPDVKDGEHRPMAFTVTTIYLYASVSGGVTFKFCPQTACR